jgi:hypothetical protein
MIWIYEQLNKGDGSVRGQKINEVYAGNAMGDDAILDCCR